MGEVMAKQTRATSVRMARARRKSPPQTPCTVAGCKHEVAASLPPYCTDHWLMVPLDVRLRITTAPPKTDEWFVAVSVAYAVIELESGDDPPEAHA